ncbi:MAG: acetyl-CoA C-acetyltransferase [Neisseriaceae bacterium]
MNKKAVIVSAKRTAIGKFGGGLAGVPAVQLGATVIRAVLEETKLGAAAVEEVVMGHVLTAGLGQNTARQAALLAGLPVEVSCFGVNLVCGSGLKAVQLAARSIASGHAEVVIAGGQESMSRAPFLIEEMRRGKKMGDASMIDSLLRDGLTDAYQGYHMGITAEKVANLHHVSREEQDHFALESQHRAIKALEQGRFVDEIAAVRVSDRQGQWELVKDEGVRAGANYESMARLKPIFDPAGTVTAANASSINDGAAAVMLMSEERAERLGLKPLATVVASETSGCTPELMGMGPVEAIKKTLLKANWKLEELELVELNEAFASQALAVMEALQLDSSLTNVNGGAIALGHPIGASGCRILVTLLHEMRKRQLSKGLAALCIGGGMGIALAVSCP